jgi:hypothetical protein
MLKRYIFSLLTVILLATAGLHAQEVQPTDSLATERDSVRISLLTCGPGDEVYSLFGHTAIRYEEPESGIDVVFNYGVFSFSTPNFALRFALGQTDYELGVTTYANFEAEYSYFNREVWQQVLNLTPDEKARFAELIRENMQHENRIYRYNFFYDNCATRPRDKIEQAVNAQITYGKLLGEGETITFREMIHKYTAGHPWSRFGIDMALGSKADRKMTEREMTFIPFYLEKAVSGATISDGRNLVSQRVKTLNNTKEKPGRDIWNTLTPLRMSLLLFILTAAATLLGIKRGLSLWGIDLLLFTAAGLAGCILLFLATMSEHPAVSPNYLLFVFHPLHLIFLPAMIFSEIKHRTSLYHAFNIAILTLFIVLYPVIPQRFDLAVVPLALCLWIRSLSNLTLTHKRTE